MESVPAEETQLVGRDVEDAPTVSVGDISIRVISDGTVDYPVDFFYSGVPEDELQSGLAGRLTERGELPVPYRCLLVQTSSQTVLIDAGLGQFAAMAGVPAGRLLDGLADVKVAPDDVDVVILSHAHPDHIGGLTRGSDLVFPKARHVMAAAEWDCWTNEDQLSRMPDLLAQPARAVLPVLGRADVMDLVSGETEVTPGVRLVPAAGHTVGHCAVLFESGANRAVFLADALLDEFQLVHPDWVSTVDMLPEETARTRTRLLDEAARDGSLVVAYHLDHIGLVERSQGRYRIS